MLPSFAGHSIFAARGAVVTAVAVLICTSVPRISEALRLPVLVPVVAIFVLQPTLGATLEIATHIGAGTVIAAAVSAVTVTALPAGFAAALGITAALASIIGFADLPPTVKRFAVGLTVGEHPVWIAMHKYLVTSGACRSCACVMGNPPLSSHRVYIRSRARRCSMGDAHGCIVHARHRARVHCISSAAAGGEGSGRGEAPSRRLSHGTCTSPGIYSGRVARGTSVERWVRR